MMVIPSHSSLVRLFAILMMLNAVAVMTKTDEWINK